MFKLLLLGFDLGTGFSLATGNSFKSALGSGVDGMVSGFAMGAISGGIEGYMGALHNNLNPWTGQSTLPELEYAMVPFLYQIGMVILPLEIYPLLKVLLG